MDALHARRARHLHMQHIGAAGAVAVVDAALLLGHGADVHRLRVFEEEVERDEEGEGDEFEDVHGLEIY